MKLPEQMGTLNKVTVKFWEEISLYVSKRNILTGFGIIILFNLVLLPGFPALFSVKNSYALDLTFGYSAETAYSMLNNLGSKGRTVYLISEIIIDLPYAIFYSFLYSVVIVAVYGYSKTGFVRYFIWLPVLIGLSDILENLSIVLMIIFYEYKITFLAAAGSLFTVGKWSFAVLTFLVVITGLIIKLGKKSG